MHYMCVCVWNILYWINDIKLSRHFLAWMRWCVSTVGITYCNKLIFLFLFMCINSINTINCMVYFWVNLYGLNYTVFCCKYCNTFLKASHDLGLIVCRRVRFWAEELEWNWWPSGWFSYTDIWQPCLTFAVIHSQCRNTLCSNLGMIVCTVCVCVLMFGLELLYFDKDQIHMFLLHMQLQLLYKKN